MNGIFANYFWTMFWRSVFWIFWLMWFFPRKYKYRCISVYVIFKDDKYVIWMWIWLILKNISLDNLETLAVCIITNVFLYHNKYMLSARQNMKFVTRHQTSYSGSAGWYIRYQSIHIQITYTYYDTGIHV
jgi:hypothetical protein